MNVNETFDFKDSLGPWIGRTMKLIDHRIEDILESQGIDLSRMQFVILKKIEQNEGINQNELAWFVKRNKSSLTRMVDTVIRKGFIQKKTSKTDKRANCLYLTEKGRSVVNQATPHFRAMAKLIEKGLTDEEIDQTIKILKKIQQNVDDADASFCQ